MIASTTAKDVKIEEFARMQNLERKKEGKFGIELYCWEDIESLLGENYRTYQWYLQNLDVQRQSVVQVCFDCEEAEIVIRPKLFRKVKKYVYTPLAESQKRSLKSTQDMIKNIQKPNLDLLQNIHTMLREKHKINYVWCNFKIFFKNCGGSALKHWELRFYMNPENGVFDDPSEQGNFLMSAINRKPRKIEWEYEVLYHDPDHYPFVQNDSCSIELSVRPNIGVNKIPIVWKLLAEDFNDNGELILVVKPRIAEKEEKIEVYDKNEEKTEEMQLEYFCEYPKDDGGERQKFSITF